VIVTSNGNEFIVDAPKREMSEEAGLELDPGPLLEPSEGGEAARTHNVELILLVEVRGVPTLLRHFVAATASGLPGAHDEWSESH
jgi:hypothetical protein